MAWSLSSMGDSPWEAQSAGFRSVGTCLHALGSTRSVIAAIKLPTNVLYRFGRPSNHAIMMELSLQACIWSIDSFRAFLMVVRILDSKEAPHSSNLYGHGLYWGNS